MSQKHTYKGVLTRTIVLIMLYRSQAYPICNV